MKPVEPSFDLGMIPILPKKYEKRGAHRKYFFYDPNGNLLEGPDHYQATRQLSRMLYVRGYDYKKEPVAQTFHFTFFNGNSFQFIPQ